MVDRGALARILGKYLPSDQATDVAEQLTENLYSGVRSSILEECNVALVGKEIDMRNKVARELDDYIAKRGLLLDA